MLPSFEFFKKGFLAICIGLISTTVFSQDIVTSFVKHDVNTSGISLGTFAGFGTACTPLGDIDNDGVEDMAITANNHNNTIFIMRMNADGSEKAVSTITRGAFGALINTTDGLGQSIANLGDVDGDNITDIAVGAPFDDDNGTSSGSIMIIFLNADGTMKGFQKISPTTGGFNGDIDAGDWFGFSLAPLGDLDGDMIPDFITGAAEAEGGATKRGELYAIFLNADGTVKEEHEISWGNGFDNDIYVGTSSNIGTHLCSMGDMDGDGSVEIITGLHATSPPGNLYALSINPDGSVKSTKTIPFHLSRTLD